ncbi:MAG: gamma-glutamyltransferase [Acidiferrobacteraceae bacterium]|jgi:gamma-glutamyltranspeptidase/glutathione hydrolase
MKSIRLLVLLISALAVPAWAGVSHPPGAAIASAHPLATRAGEEILKQGGNAFDAAVAISAALAVVEPQSSGLGGGGFWLLHRARDGYNTMVDGREKAPGAASRDMYLDTLGKPIPGKSLDGPLAAGIPGEPAALVHLNRHYGRLSLAKDLAPAIRLAREGFAVTKRYRLLAKYRRPVLNQYPAAAKSFLDQGEVPALGYRIRQPDLARTLEILAQKGRAGFYDGPIASKLVKGVRAAGGIWTRKDLRSYRVVERKPVRGRYHNVRIISAALPSSGGVVLNEALGILQAYPLKCAAPVERKHLIIEAMRRAYRDRARYLGDSDFVKVDVAHLLNPAYWAELRKTIHTRATPSKELDSEAARPLGKDTTHFSVIDREGNRVSATLSVNTPFGSAFVAPGTGVALNNEMDDFSEKPGQPNVYGLVGAEANAIAPGKRPLSSMTPTFLETKDAVVALGTPGGSRIISMVLLATLEFAEGRGTVADWVALPRYHHQYLPDVVTYEPGAFTAAELTELKKRGYELKELRPYGNMQAVMWDKRNKRMSAASDPRGEGLAWVQ